jgi:beta-fructofuranosidase
MSKELHRQLVKKANEYVFAEDEKVKNSPYRLGYHMMPPRGWMNDPNGLIYFKGEYHIFYQHYPYEAKWGPMHWGHAKSKDLVHWKHLPIALAPSEEYDSGGCFSGSAVDDNGTLTLIYTGHVDNKDPKEVQCIATSENGIDFIKYEGNPVIAYPSSEGSQDFRDPKVWRRDDDWYMVLGTGKDGIGKVLLYRSRNLREWDYVGVLLESDGSLGYMWECPDLFPLGEHHVLVLSPMKNGWDNRYFVGEMNYETGTFTPLSTHPLDCGFHFYAPQTFEDGKGRRILIGWMDMWETKMPSQAHGWAGAMTLPRELTISKDGTLLMKPVIELEMLRTQHLSFTDETISENSSNLLANVKGTRLEIRTRLEVNKDTVVGFKVRASEENGEETVVLFDGTTETLSVDLTKSGDGLTGVCQGPAPLKHGMLTLHMFLDHSSLEIFVNDGESVFTNRIYPNPTSQDVQLFVQAGTAVVKQLDVWKLKSIW